MKQDFLKFLAQTSDAPVALEFVKAKAAWLTDKTGKDYLDIISGISVSNIGHCHPAVVSAVQKQAETYMHLMVYGEYIQAPQVTFAKKLISCLPDSLQSIFLTNSGAEAIEGAMKLAKRVTKRTDFVSLKLAYHGSTQGALSLMSDSYFSDKFTPLLPGVKYIEAEDFMQLGVINSNTAAVFIELIRSEAGYIPLSKSYVDAVAQRCKQTGALLVIDEIQTGFGRTGSLFAFEQYAVVPDILVLAKGMGGGMPIGGFVASADNMACLAQDPVLGHINTFGGHPVSAAAALASLEVIVKDRLWLNAKNGSEHFKQKLQHPLIRAVSGVGYMLALTLESEELNKQIIAKCLQRGLLTDWFLFAPEKLRIAPPLIINDSEIDFACSIILSVLDEFVG